MFFPFSFSFIALHQLASSSLPLGVCKTDYAFISQTHCDFQFVQDALRLYIINSPVVRAEPLRFKKEGVHGVVSSYFKLSF